MASERATRRSLLIGSLLFVAGVVSCSAPASLPELPADHPASGTAESAPRRARSQTLELTAPKVVPPAGSPTPAMGGHR